MLISNKDTVYLNVEDVHIQLGPAGFFAFFYGVGVAVVEDVTANFYYLELFTWTFYGTWTFFYPDFSIFFKEL